MTLSTRISKWIMELQEFQYSFKVEDSVRAQLAGILTYRVHERDIKVLEVKTLPLPPPKSLPNAFTLFFDGALRKATGKAEGGLVLHDSNGKFVMKKHVKLPDSTSNNEAKYDIILHGLQVCVSQKIRRLMVKGDALLIVKQILGIWACKNERLREKVQAIRRFFNQFEEVQLYHIPRKQNEVADLLAQKAVACNESEVQVILVAIVIKQPRFGTPLEIVSDNGPGCRKGLLTEVCDELHILYRHSNPYYPQSNGLVEKANGIVAGIIRKMVKNKTKLWDDFLDGALWAYRTTYKEATDFTTFHLVYGQEALQPIKLNIPTIQLHGKVAQGEEEAWADHLLTLAELEWKREVAYECYKSRATQVKDKLNKKVKDKGIKEGDLVLMYDNRLDNHFDVKFNTRWQGPYIVKKAFNSSYYELMDLDGKEHSKKVNGYNTYLGKKGKMHKFGTNLCVTQER
ncbi:hypothetical protein L7F22_021383 [Adiantum nelumboides]|nr:hypothetical protein [Adiantum nelumboides]